MIPFSTAKQIRILYNSSVLFCICTHEIHLSSVSASEWTNLNKIVYNVFIKSNLSYSYVSVFIKCYRVICLTIHSSYLEYLSVQLCTKAQIRRFDDVRNTSSQNNFVISFVT